MDTELQDQFPNLDQVLGGYLNQDFDIYGPALEDAVDAYIDDAPAAVIAETRLEIARFLELKANDLDGELERLSAGYSREPGMAAREYLFWLDGLLRAGLARKARAS
jgi:hypothetical protein